MRVHGHRGRRTGGDERGTNGPLHVNAGMQEEEKESKSTLRKASLSFFPSSSSVLWPQGRWFNLVTKIENTFLKKKERYFFQKFTIFFEKQTFFVNKRTL